VITVDYPITRYDDCRNDNVRPSHARRKATILRQHDSILDVKTQDK